VQKDSHKKDMLLGGVSFLEMEERNFYSVISSIFRTSTWPKETPLNHLLFYEKALIHPNKKALANKESTRAFKEFV